MIRVAVDITAFAQNPHGGIARVCRATAEELARQTDVQVTACYRYGRKPHFTSAIDVRHAGLLAYLCTPKFDVAHSLCHRRLTVRAGLHVYSVHDAWSLYSNPYQSPDFQRKLSARLRRDLENADWIVTGSEWTKSELVRLNVVDPARCAVIPDGVVIPSGNSEVDDTPSKYGLRSRGYVLFVGRLESRKNLPHVIEAVRNIGELKLVCVGEPGYGYESEVVTAFSMFPKERLMVLSGVSDVELAGFYVRALATVQPSWEEGFGLPVLEAMAHGCPVITADRTATREIGEGAAVLVDPEIPRQSHDALQRLAQDETWRQELVAAGLARAREFTWNRYGDSLVALYRELLAD